MMTENSDGFYISTSLITAQCYYHFRTLVQMVQINATLYQTLWMLTLNLFLRWLKTLQPLKTSDKIHGMTVEEQLMMVTNQQIQIWA